MFNTDIFVKGGECFLVSSKNIEIKEIFVLVEWSYISKLTYHLISLKKGTVADLQLFNGYSKIDDVLRRLNDERYNTKYIGQIADLIGYDKVMRPYRNT